MTEQKWEIVDVVNGEFQAELLRGLLESQGIRVLLSQEGAGRAIGLSIGLMGEIQILVPTSSKTQAQQVLQEYYAGQFTVDDQEELDSDEQQEEDTDSNT